MWSPQPDPRRGPELGVDSRHRGAYHRARRTPGPACALHVDARLARARCLNQPPRKNVLSPAQSPVTRGVSMSDGYGAAVSNDTTTRDENGSLETAKQEASDLKDTAVSEAGHVAETAKGA